MKNRAIVAIDSVYELLRVSDFFKMRLNNYVFRGQNKSVWDIETSFERYRDGKKIEYWNSIEGPKPIGTHLTKYLAKVGGANEYEEILEFSDNWEKDCGVRHDNLTSAALRRCFRCPSRLLDVTKSFDCALYFANEGKEIEDDSAIWAICTDQISKRAEKIFYTAKERFGDEGWENRLVEEILCSEQTYESVPIVLLVGTMKCVPRMVAQEGMFLMPLSKCFMTSLSYSQWIPSSLTYLRICPSLSTVLFPTTR